MSSIRGIAHVVLGVRDLSLSVQFYQQVLGLEVVKRLDSDEMNVAFLSFGKRDHDVALMQLGDDQIIASPGFTHVAFELDGGEQELKQLHANLKKFNVTIELVTDHVVSKSIYFIDPDGNRLEVLCQIMEQHNAKQFIHNIKSIDEVMQPLEL